MAPRRVSRPAALRRFLAGAVVWACASLAARAQEPVELTLTKSSPFHVRVHVRIVRLDRAVQVSVLGGEIEFPASAKFDGRLISMQAYLYGPLTDGGKERVSLAFSSPVRYDRVMIPGTKFHVPPANLVIAVNADRAGRIESSYVTLGFTYKTKRSVGGQETFVATPETIFRSAPTATPAPQPAATPAPAPTR